jgi:hypothetical protein
MIRMLTVYMARIVAYKVTIMKAHSMAPIGEGKKGKVVPLRSIEALLGERRYSSYSFLTSALEGGEWSATRPGRALPPVKEPPVPLV